MVVFRQKVLLSYYFIVAGCKLGEPSSTSDNQQHGCTKLFIRGTANCAVAPNIFIILTADLFLTFHVCIVPHAHCWTFQITTGFTGNSEILGLRDRTCFTSFFWRLGCGESAWNFGKFMGPWFGLCSFLVCLSGTRGRQNKRGSRLN